MSEDPLGFKAGVNFYAYVGNNPLNFNDPSGLLFSFTLNAISRDPMNFQDAQRISNFTNTVALGGTGIAAAPFLTPQIMGIGIAGIEGVPVIAASAANGAVATINGVTRAGQATVAGTSAFTGLTAEQITTFGVLGGEAALMTTFGVQGPSFTPSFAGNTEVTRAFDLSSATTMLADLGDRAITSTIDFFSGLFGGSPQPSSANGGFVLYPNKINNNQTNSVYSK